MRPIKINIIRVFAIICILAIVGREGMEFQFGNTIVTQQNTSNDRTAETASFQLENNNDVIFNEEFPVLANEYNNEKIYLPTSIFYAGSFIAFVWQPPKVS